VKGLKWVGIIGVVVIVIAGFFAALDMGEKSPVFVSGTITIPEEYKGDAAGVATLFVIIYDANSPMPMPFGAMKEPMPADLSQPIPFLVTKESLQTMNPDAPAPEVLRVKVRIDKDGIAGPDQPGDLTGGAEQIRFGERNLGLVINKKT